MRNIVVIKYKRSSAVNQGCVDKIDASFYCQGGEFEAKTLVSWLKDNLVSAAQYSEEEWDKLPDEYVED